MASLKLISATDTQYSAAVLKSMNEQRNHGLFCDITIIIQERKFRAHKTILSASSTYFHQLFSVAGQVIELNFIRAEIFEEILNYIYSSRIVRVRSDLLEELISAGQILGVKFIANLGVPLSQVKGLPGLSKDTENSAGKNDVLTAMPIITESFSLSAEEFNQKDKSAGKEQDSDSDDVLFVSTTDAQTIAAEKSKLSEIIDLEPDSEDDQEKNLKALPADGGTSSLLNSSASSRGDHSPMGSPDTSANIPSLTSGVSSDSTRPSMPSGISPGGTRPSLPSGISSGSMRPSMPSGISPGGTRPSLPSGISSGGTRPSLPSGISSGGTRPSLPSGISPGGTRPSLPSGISPGGTRPSLPSGISAGGTRPSMPSGVSSGSTRPSLPSGVSPGSTRPSLPSGVSPGSTRPSLPSGFSPGSTRLSLPSGFSPGSMRPSLPSGISPGSTRLSLPSGISPGSTSTQTNQTSPFTPGPHCSSQPSQNHAILGVHKKQVHQGDSKIRLLDVKSPSSYINEMGRNVPKSVMTAKKTITLDEASEIDSLSTGCKVYTNIGENTYDIVPMKDDPGEGGSKGRKGRKSLMSTPLKSLDADPLSPEGSPGLKKAKTEQEDHYELIMDGKTFFVCIVCKRPYVCLTSLRRHYNTHSWERRYPCHYCNKVFALAEYRTKHEINHTGERRYQCLLCNGMFINYQLLSTHCKQAHNEDPSGRKERNDGGNNLYRLLPCKTLQLKSYSYVADDPDGIPVINEDGLVHHINPNSGHLADQGLQTSSQGKMLNWDDIFVEPGAPDRPSTHARPESHGNPPPGSSEFEFVIPETY